MHMRRSSSGFAVLVILAVSCSYAAPVPGQSGYLTKAEAIDSVQFLPPPPVPGSKEAAYDLDVYTRLRALKDAPRWKLAATDDVITTDALMADFSCALGVDFDRKSAPKFAALFDKAWHDAGNAIGTGKTFFKRPRPLIGNDLPICAKRADYLNSWSYPSGHSTLSWTFTLILTELAPDRAGEIVKRGRAYGDSRAVCGVHWASDVEAGRTAGAAAFAALNGNAAFRKDLAAVRREIDALRRTAPKPDAGQCRALAPLLNRPW
jgi:acid phosphatase (class A)